MSTNHFVHREALLYLPRNPRGGNQTLVPAALSHVFVSALMMVTLPPLEQEVCGDYEQTAGELTFEPGQTEKSFFIRIMDDHCQER